MSYYFFIKNIVNIYDQDALGNSILHLVAQSGSVHCCEFLFDLYFKRDSRLNDKNRNLNDTLALIGEFSQTLNSFKMTPLHSACKVFYSLNYFYSQKIIPD